MSDLIRERKQKGRLMLSSVSAYLVIALVVFQDKRCQSKTGFALTSSTAF